MTKIKKFLTGIFAVVFAVTLGFGGVGAKSAKADDQPPPPPENYELTAETMSIFISLAMPDIFEQVHLDGIQKLCIIIDGALMPSYIQGMNVDDCADEYLISNMAQELSDVHPNVLYDPSNLQQFFSLCKVRLFVYSRDGTDTYSEITKSSPTVVSDITNYDSFLARFHLREENCIFTAMTAWTLEQNLYDVLSNMQDVLGGHFADMPTYIYPLTEFSTTGEYFYVKVFDWDTYTLSLTTI